MEARKIGILAGAVSALSLVAHIVPGVLLDRWIQGGFQSELPVMFGSVGETATILTSLVETVGPLVTLLLGMGLGYSVGRRVAVRSHYRRFLGVVGVGSTVGVVFLWAIVMALGSSFSPLDVGAILIMVVIVVRMLVTVSLVIVVGAFAGVALAHFRKTTRSPVRPTKTDTEGHSRRRNATSEGEGSHS